MKMNIGIERLLLLAFISAKSHPYHTCHKLNLFITLKEMNQISSS